MTAVWYAGIGARDTPGDVLAVMVDLAKDLARRGWILRSGGAAGADSAFEEGAGDLKEIFLPWPRFNGSDSVFCRPPAGSYEIAAQYHPAWWALSGSARSLMARNTQQVLGERLDHASALALCWTRDGVELGAETSRLTGGTGQAIRVACGHGIPVVNIAKFGWEQRFESIVGEFTKRPIRQM